MRIERGRPSTASKPMAIVINSNFRDVVTGIRDADVASVIKTDFQPEVDEVINGPLYQPEADGVIQRGDIYQDKAEPMQHAPKESEYRPEAQVNPVGVGYTEVEWSYFAENVGGTATQLQENCANGTFVKGGQLGYTEVEWTYIGDNLSGTAGPGGSTFRTGYAEAVGLDGYMVCPEPQWFMNNVAGSAGPGCDDI